MMTFSCGCGARLIAYLFEPPADAQAEVRIYRRSEASPERGLVPVTKCPTVGCERDFRGLTPDALLSQIWPGG